MERQKVRCLVSEAMDKCQCDECKMIREASDFAMKAEAETIIRKVMDKTMEEHGYLEDLLYKLLRELGYEVEMSEAYVPIEQRRYAVIKEGKVKWQGDLLSLMFFTGRALREMKGEE